MSAAVEGSEQDFDLNITPIIDCFTVLIAYLLISASFVSIGFFEVGASTTAEVTTPTQTTVQESLTVGLGAAGVLELKLTGPETQTIALPARAGRWDFEGLVAAAAKIHNRLPSLNEASVTAGSKVEYREVIHAIEALKKEIPKVFVGE